MVKFTLFLDRLRQEEIDMFYDTSQMHREYYKGYPTAYHPRTYFYRSPKTELFSEHLVIPYYHVKYKQPATLPPFRSQEPVEDKFNLAGRFNKAACKAFKR